MFITDAIRTGLPPHIAQVIAGHANINTTMGCNAVYPTETIEAHRAFVTRRRTLRPAEEYRTPTDTEWEDFPGHFERRKLSVGTCARTYGITWIHDHACVRCSLLRPDLAQRGRLVETATTCSTGWPRPTGKADSARSKDSASASPGPNPRSARSTRRRPAAQCCRGCRLHGPIHGVTGTEQGQLPQLRPALRPRPGLTRTGFSIPASSRTRLSRAVDCWLTETHL
ncbi:hypothetical protein [Streptomyces justiciae]|uniref:Integrase n=1 Tax=Streptomyces justiciae TaxID=2780140 RepID=A0ABU3M7A1_9ACTN|nr:hypothetical protein [Streptomyces justiciae]MDT7847315.1 hypothetical protein [Streptomyces justiciae]